MKNFKLAIFDLDGTILDSAGLWHEVDRAFLASIGREWDQEYHDTMRVSDYDSGARYTIARYGLKTTPEALKKHWESLAQQAYHSNLELKEGVKHVLESFRRCHVPLVLCTLSPQVLYKPALERHGILSYFSSFYSIDRHHFDKKTPAIFQRILQEHKVEALSCVGFEDSPVAAQSMFKAGIKTYLIADEGQPGAKDEAPEAHYLPSWNALTLQCLC